MMSLQDEAIFQSDIDSITKWANTWQMNLNLEKCNIMSITRSKSEIDIRYNMSGKPLGVVSCHKYLGIFIQCKMIYNEILKLERLSPKLLRS